MKRFPPDFYAMEPVVSNDELQEMASTVENERALLSTSVSTGHVAPCVGNKVELPSTLGSTQVETMSFTAHTCGLSGCMSQSSHQQSMTEHFLSDLNSLNLLQQQPIPVVQSFGCKSKQNDSDFQEAAVFLMPPTLHPIMSAGMNVVSDQSDQSSKMRFVGSTEEESLVAPMPDFGIAPKHSMEHTAAEKNGIIPVQQASELQTSCFWSGFNAMNALGVAIDDDVVVNDIFKISSYKSSTMPATPVNPQKRKKMASEMERSLHFVGSNSEGMQCNTQVDDFPVKDFDEMVFALQDVDVEFEDACENDDPWTL